MQTFDIAIIGAGPGGYATALRAAQLSRSVVLIERDCELGGTCLNRGCIPSKALLGAAHTLDSLRHADHLGIDASINAVDWSALGAHRDQTVATMRSGLQTLIAQRNITVIHALASFDAHETTNDGLHIIHLDTTESDNTVDDTIAARDVVLATGSSPRALDGVAFDGTVLDSTAALALNQAPKTAAIIGSGAIAVEFASLWNAVGCDVTLLIRNDHVLSSWDTRTSAQLTRELQRRGITIIDHAQVSTVESNKVIYTRDGRTERTDANDATLVAIGRTPNTTTAWHVSLDTDGFVSTDDFGLTSAEHVWAVGDITRGAMLAHRAFAQSITVAERICDIPTTPVDANAVPHVVFSLPEAASIGLTFAQAQASDEYANVNQTIYPAAANSRMMMAEETGSMVVISGQPSDAAEPIVLGVHMVAPNASELIAEAQQLVGNRVPLNQAARLVHSHPTFSEMLGETLLKADGRPLHIR